MKIQTLLAGVLFLFSAGMAQASTMMDYVFSYFAPGGGRVDGELQSDGVDADGFLTGVSNVRMSVGNFYGPPMSPMLNVPSITGYSWSPIPRIPADGTLNGIEFTMWGETWNFQPTTFHLQELRNSGSALPYIEAEVEWTEAIFSPGSSEPFLFRHGNEYYGTGATWTLSRAEQPSASSVPETGQSVVLMGMGLAGLLVVSRRLR